MSYRTLELNTRQKRAAFAEIVRKTSTKRQLRKLVADYVYQRELRPPLHTMAVVIPLAEYRKRLERWSQNLIIHVCIIRTVHFGGLTKSQ